MAKELVTDELWEAIEPLPPPEPPKPRGGRPCVPDRAALAGIVFFLKTGIPWEMPPRWAVGRLRRAGGGCAPGRRRACGAGWSGPCWTGSGRRRRSTGRGRLWTRRAWRPKGGREGPTGPLPRPSTIFGDAMRVPSLPPPRGLPLVYRCFRGRRITQKRGVPTGRTAGSRERDRSDRERPPPTSVVPPRSGCPKPRPAASCSTRSPPTTPNRR